MRRFSWYMWPLLSSPRARIDQRHLNTLVARGNYRRPFIEAATEGGKPLVDILKILSGPWPEVSLDKRQGSIEIVVVL